MTSGRPKLPEGEAKDRMLVCRVRQSEEDAVRAAAAAEGKSVSEWMRETLVSTAERRLRAADKRKRPSKKSSRKRRRD